MARSRLLRPALLVLLLPIALLAVGSSLLLPRLGGSRLATLAASRGMNARWKRVEGRFPTTVRFEDLTVSSGQGDTLFQARSASVALSPLSVVLMRPRISGATLEHARLELPRHAAVDPDTLVPEPRRSGDRREDPARAERLRRAAESVVQLLLTPARQLPRLTLRDVTLEAGADDETPLPGVRFERLELRQSGPAAQLEATGTLQSEDPMPFHAAFEYTRSDRLRGGLVVSLPDSQRGSAAQMRIGLDGVVRQDRRAGRVTIDDSTRVQIGDIPLRVGGSFERRGPRVGLSLAAHGITEERFESSLPPGVLGPLAHVGVRGSWDYRLAFDLDFAKPDSVKLEADVVPHGLALDPHRARLRLVGLSQPFVAIIHLPQGRQTTRLLSAENPSFRPLEAISPHLVHAVVTNEDGAFFRHRGFNPEAMREAIAENVKAGAFRRGAGTITMQLARNLYLGHERSLSRKFREVVLAWVLENLTGVSKQRLLEIYLNIIEWGPGIHGAAEATRFYFDRDPADVTVDEALFLSTIVPAPAKWRYRFDAAGALRPYARAQMHFIGRAMVAKGWLDPAALPPADGLHVELRGAARRIATPDTPAAVDTLGAAREDPGRSPVDPLPGAE